MKPRTAAQIRQVDERAIREFAIPSIVLMENAGRGAADRIRMRWPAARFGVLCGAGNNGGDGLVIARHLEAAGCRVQVVLLAEPTKLSQDTRINWEICRRVGLPLTIDLQPDAEWMRQWFDGCDVIVDAMLGTGAKGTPRSPYREAIEISADLPDKSRVAIDLPTGMDADTGQAAEPCFRADLTLTFVAPKLGFIRPEAARLTGDVEVLPIGVPRVLLDEAPDGSI
jgi:NAD(P)H-hydrate epimerase